MSHKGWFWHAGESPLSAERLFQMYLETVGRNATLILNLPPDKSGSLPPATVNVMTDLGELLTKRLGTDLARNAKVTVSEERKAGAARNYVATNLTDDNKDTYWAPNDRLDARASRFRHRSCRRPSTSRFLRPIRLHCQSSGLRRQDPT